MTIARDRTSTSSPSKHLQVGPSIEGIGVGIVAFDPIQPVWLQSNSRMLWHQERDR